MDGPVLSGLLPQIAESGVSAILLTIVLWIFLPRIIKSIDLLTDANTRQHQAMTTMLVHLEQRLQWHEAKVYGVNPSTGETREESCRAAIEAFQQYNRQLEVLRHDIQILFNADRDKKHLEGG